MVGGRTIRACVAAAAALAAAIPAGADDPVLHPPPRGPLLGHNSWGGEIRDDGAPDRDLFAGALLAGERLSVEVRGEPGPDGGPALRPAIAIFDPLGAPRTATVEASADGTAARVRRFPIDRTGRWAVVVSGAEDAEGPYRVRFRIHRARGRGAARLRLPGPDEGVAECPIDALRGSVIDLDLRAPGPGGLPPFFEILDPNGEPVPLAAALLRRRDGAWRLHGLSLDGPDGTWRVLVGVGAGEDAFLRWRLRAAARPRGDGVLLPYEPSLDARPAPLVVGPGGLVRVEGRGFCPHPAPAVLLDGAPVGVLGIDPGGRFLEALLPPRPGGTLAALAIVNPDGQACEAGGYLVYGTPGPALLADLVPSELRLPAGGQAQVRVRLTGMAPPTGAWIPLRLTEPVASLPESVFVPPYRTEAAFWIDAGGAGGTAILEATLGTTARATVRVDPPPPPGEIDLSGWRIDQTDSTRWLIFPPGTVLPEGGRVVVARDCSRAQFEAFWGRPLGAGVLFVDSDDLLPSFNGAEKLWLRDASGVTHDGPTIVLTVGSAYRRLPGDGDSWLSSSWSTTTAAPGLFAPADGPLPSTGGVRIAAFADPGATGQFIYEFVEIAFAK